MTISQLRRSGGSLTLTVPVEYRRAHGLQEGQEVEVQIEGDTMTMRPATRPITLQAIIDSAPDDAATLRVPGWDEMSSAGSEL